VEGPSSQAGSIRSLDRQSEQISTGSVSSEQPVLRRAGPSGMPSIPSILVSNDQDVSDGTSSQASYTIPQEMRAVRVKSHTAKVSRWSESEQSDKGVVTWDRVPSMASSAGSASRDSRAISERSSRSRRAPSPIPELHETLHSPYPRSSMASEAASQHPRDPNRLSDVSAVSSSSTVRRMQGLVNELDFGEVKR
jgi:hypothetical protein